ncbi:hypothetical protein A9Q76_00385 [Arcobacter sp. 31_11_sub10_T18]|nr:hypothetical protein A9Q76_00385 [Arcobacter sp. 31_11_sub10_T18]
MTQDELDALMAGDVDLDSLDHDVKEMEKKEDIQDGHEHKHYNDNHLVSQLGEVTQESEMKATEIFDKLDTILVKLDEMDKAEEKSTQGISEIRDVIFETMSIMQYQDIHRQKIERVINTMRSISQLMSHTLDSVSPKAHAPSAKHISGDNDTSDLMDEAELEALIAQMGSK